ncbi:CRM-domain containing factor CFM9, mitochondrial isoform X2 [Phoenix dactylifera]|uniref:CRM-domain containing factor CFM9, mitochondrial isoform X2 n=1 Tax=Phoenix dactylifera TaxID=42345 RepID=A0A8B8J818_PHODC|nr:CRM-domain containing factor CFM9, mitochondrial isoform X2 [Phoenix dactylifera]
MAKKKVALLLQKLKKYELPDLPPPRHDPELLTPEQLQAYKKIGFRNRNYVPVGVRGVFGGVVQNMHLHWKFHETVQVCCDNFPKEKIKEMATMLARLSGGIVVNIHNVKTVIMFRGRNYRQPKNLIPINTLTKRKALFKARFEQALESQKLNIKKIEQQLRRKGVNPEDPVAMASIQRVASTFFRAIDEKQGTPYVFHGDRQPTSETIDMPEDAPDLPSEDSDQEELDRFIAEIEDAADQEWAAEEAAEKEESTRIRYWGTDDTGMQGRSPKWRGDSEDVDGDHGRRWNSVSSRQRNTAVRKWDSGDEISDASEGEDWDSDDEVGEGVANIDSDTDREDYTHRSLASKREKSSSLGREEALLTRTGSRSLRERANEVDAESDGDMLGDADDGLWETDDEEKHGSPAFRGNIYDYHSGSDEEDGNSYGRENAGIGESKKRIDDSWDSD